MKATVLIDNNLDTNSDNSSLAAEWGLSFFIEYDSPDGHNHRILLDTGASDSFADNADALGIDLASVEFGVLSHAHYDHANGMETFFRNNRTAPFFVGAGAAENCYHGFGPEARYIGMPEGIFAAYHNRIVNAGAEGATIVTADGKEQNVLVFGDDSEEVRELIPGVKLAGHRKAFLAQHGVDLAELGVKADMYVCEGAACSCENIESDQSEAVWRPDSFDHEQSLIFETEKGLVIFNSCCHGGADNIIKEISDMYPNQSIYAIIGGFHLYETPDGEVYQFAERLKETGVQKVITGHCTGDRGCEILSEVLAEKMETLYTGKVIEL